MIRSKGRASAKRAGPNQRPWRHFNGDRIIRQSLRSFFLLMDADARAASFLSDSSRSQNIHELDSPDLDDRRMVVTEAACKTSGLPAAEPVQPIPRAILDGFRLSVVYPSYPTIRLSSAMCTFIRTRIGKREL